jgi:EAL domain-containing protein (putative c-di-GMP-specific phosphodiesterase class I)
MEELQPLIATPNGRTGHQACLTVLSAQSSQRGSQCGEPRKDAWQLSGQPTAGAPTQTAVVCSQRFFVGRQPDNDLSVVNPTVSKRHAEFVWSDGELSVRDLGSTNGTFINGRRVRDLERVRDGDRLQFGTAAFTASRCGQSQSWATVSEDVAALAHACMQFDRLLSEPAAVPYFQPIVRMSDCGRIGYEVLARSSLSGLESPAQMFRVAAELGMEKELSCLMRREGLRVGQALGADKHLYLNTHPVELYDRAILDSISQLRAEFPETIIVLEVHEAAIASLGLWADLRARCGDLGIRLAFDDFGIGQSRLVELAEAPPHVIKFDMRMIRGIDGFPPERRQMIKSLVEMARGLDVVALAEGVETAEEAAACRDVGFELVQGYYFGRPSPADAW